MPRSRSDELTLATALASTTDKGRAEILANMEGDASPKAEAKDTESSTNPVKQQMEVNEALEVADKAWSEVHDAVYAAQEACRKDKESNPDGDAEGYFKARLGNLIDVLQEMLDTKDVFKQMAKSADKSKLY